MVNVPHPEVLAHDWLPPTLVGRAEELDRLRALLGDPVPDRALPWAAIVRGPAGSGTSSTARLAARRLLESYRRDRPGATAPLLVAVRVRWCAGSHGVATALLQSLDDGFSGQGFPVVEIVAGFLRRLTRLGRPAIVVLDDVGPDTPDLAPILRGLLAPL
ncbi:MAG TPA: AAA family ATPase, partial [Thermoplasmata archaeon]|nr:AAA family ATPase [Thermoplasmata archaeon]